MKLHKELNLFKKLKNLNWLDYIIQLIIVFIGVSMAFYMGEKAEIGKIEIEEKNYLIMIEEDLINTAKEDSIIKTLLNKRLKDFVVLRDLIKSNNKAKLDTLVKAYIKVSKLLKYHPRVQTYELLAESGEVLKLSDFELRKQLAKYYAYRNNLKTHFKDVDKIKSTELIPYIHKHYDFFNETVVNPDAFFEIELLNKLYRLRQVLNNRIGAFNKAINLNEQIQSLMIETKKKHGL